MLRVMGVSLVATISVLTFDVQHTYAQSLTGNVGSANITDGERAIETRFGINGDGDAAARVHADYAFTDWHQLRTIAAFSRPDGGDWDFRGLTFENWLQWRKEATDQSGFNGGIRLGYTFVDGGGADQAGVRLAITDKFAARWEWRANLIGEIETGQGSDGGVGIEARAQSTRGFAFSALGANDWRLGAEILSEFGNSRDIPGLEDQVHQVGPVVKIEWGNGVYVQSAARVGLTSATDDFMAKLFIGREF